MLIISALLLSGIAAGAQRPADPTVIADSARRSIEVSRLAADVQGVVRARAMLERALVVMPDDPWLLHYHGYALYREAILREARKEDVTELRERADSLLERSAKLRPIAESYALRASLLGQMIGRSAWKGMTLGPRSGAEMDRAVKLSPSNPRVLLLRGSSAMFTPKTFGGGEEKAEEYLKKAIEAFATDKPTTPAPAWGHGEAYTWLGRLYERQGKLDAALAAYNRALELEPDNLWVKTILLPGLNRPR